MAQINLKKIIVENFITKIMLIMLVLLVIGVVLFLVGFGKNTAIEYVLAYEIGKAIIVTILISIALNMFISTQSKNMEAQRKAIEDQAKSERDQFLHEKEEEFKNTIKSQLLELKREVLNQTADISKKSSCFDAMQASSVDRIFTNREEASIEISRSIMNDNNEVLKIMGISLNDFVRYENEDLSKAWRYVQDKLTGKIPLGNGKEYHVEILLIDPYSEGAFLRSSAEAREGDYSRLSDEVKHTMELLFELEKRVASLKNDGISLSVMQYRSSPSVFLVLTSNTVFIEPYYFRPNHKKSNYPMMNFYNSGKIGGVYQELAFHFEWVWKTASVTLKEQMSNSSFGNFETIRSARITNMYYDYAISKQRIIKLIEDSKDFLFIKGISLHSYFSFESIDLFSSLMKACERGVRIRVLLLNPNCEQAKMRSFREYLIKYPSAKYEDFSEKARKYERLYTDTISTIRFMMTELRSSIETDKIGVNLFHSAPECFSLINDDSTLVEQYQYGKIPSKDHVGLILGGDIPLFEYSRSQDNTDASTRKDPYNLFKYSFEYVYDYCSISVEDFIKQNDDVLI